MSHKSESEVQSLVSSNTLTNCTTFENAKEESAKAEHVEVSADPNSESSLPEEAGDNNQPHILQNLHDSERSNSNVAGTTVSKDETHRFSKAMIIAKYWKPLTGFFAFAATSIMLVLTALAVWPAIVAKNEGHLSEELAVWEAKKDFIEFCIDNVQADAHPDCKLAQNVTLSAPPRWVGRFKRSLVRAMDAVHKYMLSDASETSKPLVKGADSVRRTLGFVVVLLVFFSAFVIMSLWRTQRETESFPKDKNVHHSVPRSAVCTTVRLRRPAKQIDQGCDQEISAWFPDTIEEIEIVGGDPRSLAGIRRRKTATDPEEHGRLFVKFPDEPDLFGTIVLHRGQPLWDHCDDLYPEDLCESEDEEAFMGDLKSRQGEDEFDRKPRPLSDSIPDDLSDVCTVTSLSGTDSSSTTAVDIDMDNAKTFKATRVYPMSIRPSRKYIIAMRSSELWLFPMHQPTFTKVNKARKVPFDDIKKIRWVDERNFQVQLAQTKDMSSETEKVAKTYHFRAQNPQSARDAVKGIRAMLE
ncbi:hypothetical protein EV356DRAFT_516918 [Viridothelium virens]|uniref:Uncharacterized protein n=1 Tax=Viridothelium virens TaxID=1048519 RepID=A0A6A6H618_VIRVR|nr:hypothetical protein EV356DRAFT_516918 [Viridothelium virens]